MKRSKQLSGKVETEEEVQKWIEERRKRFPTAARQLERAADTVEAGIAASPRVPHMKRKSCLYFMRGSCRNGEACSYNHQMRVGKLRPKKSLLERLDAFEPQEKLLEVFRFLVEREFLFE